MRGTATVMASKRVRGSRSSDDWCTPEVVLECVRAFGPILLDPCTTKRNPARAERVFTVVDNGLEQSWDIVPGGVCFVNPPYSNVARWADRASLSWAGSRILLVPARTDTRWFHKYVWERANLVAFWRGRLVFKGAPTSAPFPSALALYSHEETAAERFTDAFCDVARAVIP